MVKRIHAFKTIFNLLLTVVELLIGVGFLINMFGSSEAIASLMGNVHSAFEQMDYGTSSAVSGIDLEGPVSFLVMILGFMIFSFILMTIVPGAARRMERELEEDFE